jgi:hypothetical protein
MRLAIAIGWTQEQKSEARSLLTPTGCGDGSKLPAQRRTFHV